MSAKYSIQEIRNMPIVNIIIDNHKEFLLVNMELGFVLTLYGPSFPNCIEIDHNSKTFTPQRPLKSHVEARIKAYLKIEHYETRYKEITDRRIIILQ